MNGGYSAAELVQLVQSKTDLWHLRAAGIRCVRLLPLTAGSSVSPTQPLPPITLAHDARPCSVQDIY